MSKVSSASRVVGAFVLAAAAGSAWAAPTPAVPDLAMRVAIALTCSDATLGVDAMAARLPGVLPGTEVPLPATGTPVGWRRSFPLKEGGTLIVERVAPKGALRSVVAEYDEPLGGATRPAFAMFTSPSCAIAGGRQVIYAPSGEPVAVAFLDEALSPTGRREALDAAVPPGTDPGGVTVAQVDTGVNYRLPAIADRLARDPTGKALGYDYWDMTDRPFDRHIVNSLFFPERHGTLVASVLLREAPHIRLIPYRYPRPAMERFAALFDDAAAKGARILTLSLGSDDKKEWASFAAAALRHPDMLVITSAGNDGRDLDKLPVYPAAFDLPNQLTVTTSDAKTGRLAPDANWGHASVDLAVPAENIAVTGFDGDAETVSGSSFAAPRIAALAARLLLTHPDWHAAELKAAILSRATPSRDGRLRAGFIADPSAD